MNNIILYPVNKPGYISILILFLKVSGINENDLKKSEGLITKFLTTESTPADKLIRLTAIRFLTNCKNLIWLLFLLFF